jgi:tRNA-splicing ligase RtcB
VTPKWDLAFLPIDEPVARAYFKEMRYAVGFALENRVVMARFVREAFTVVLGNSLSFDNTINVAHNYAAQEHYHGKNPIIHRKGATSARAGQVGIIPGSQGTASYIVEGLGNPKSFNSCSHGAGRKLGRKQAQRTLNIEEEVGRLDEKGILHGIRGESDLDEAPGAYKNIDEVMANQSDLVKVITRLTPMGVIKG